MTSIKASPRGMESVFILASTTIGGTADGLITGLETYDLSDVGAVGKRILGSEISTPDGRRSFRTIHCTTGNMGM